MPPGDSARQRQMAREIMEARRPAFGNDMDDDAGTRTGMLDEPTETEGGQFGMEMPEGRSHLDSEFM